MPVLHQIAKCSQLLVIRLYPSLFISPLARSNVNNITFGYFWWKDTVRNVIFAWEHGGQFVFINKDKNLIVVMTSEPRTNDKFEVHAYDGLSIYDRINNIVIE